MKVTRYNIGKCHPEACLLGRRGSISGRSVTKESTGNRFSFAGFTILSVLPVTVFNFHVISTIGDICLFEKISPRVLVEMTALLWFFEMNAMFQKIIGWLPGMTTKIFEMNDNKYSLLTT
jgi:hypothetical protein